MKNDVELEVVWLELNDKYEKVKISREKFKQLCEKFGIYRFDWYLMDRNTIKYFDGKEWRVMSL